MQDSDCTVSGMQHNAIWMMTMHTSMHQVFPDILFLVLQKHDKCAVDRQAKGVWTG